MKSHIKWNSEGIHRSAGGSKPKHDGESSFNAPHPFHTLCCVNTRTDIPWCRSRLTELSLAWNCPGAKLFACSEVWRGHGLSRYRLLPLPVYLITCFNGDVSCEKAIETNMQTILSANQPTN